jgi:hypothetical protein
MTNQIECDDLDLDCSHEKLLQAHLRNAATETVSHLTGRGPYPLRAEK